MSKRKSRDDVEPSREFPNPFGEYSGGQLLDAGGKVGYAENYPTLTFTLYRNLPKATDGRFR